MRVQHLASVGTNLPRQSRIACKFVPTRRNLVLGRRSCLGAVGRLGGVRASRLAYAGAAVPVFWRRSTTTKATATRTGQVFFWWPRAPATDARGHPRANGSSEQSNGFGRASQNPHDSEATAVGHSPERLRRCAVIWETDHLILMRNGPWRLRCSRLRSRTSQYCRGARTRHRQEPSQVRVSTRQG